MLQAVSCGLVGDAPPQLMPAGLLVIVPAPAPFLTTVSVAVPGRNVTAVTRAAPAVTVTLQTGPIIESHPDQPPTVELAAGVAVRVTTVPTLNVLVQGVVQFSAGTPGGLAVTVPPPLPYRFTVREFVAGRAGVLRKLADTDRAAVIVTVQLMPLTESHPVQPPKVELTPGSAVNVTLLFAVKFAVQAVSAGLVGDVVPQVMPAGLLTT